MLWQKYAKIRNETITLGNYIISALVLIYIPSCSYSSDIPKLFYIECKYMYGGCQHYRKKVSCLEFPTFTIFHPKIRFKNFCKGIKL